VYLLASELRRFQNARRNDKNAHRSSWQVSLLSCDYKHEWRQTEYECAIYNIMETPSVDLQLLNADRKIRAVSELFIENTRKMIYARLDT